MKSNLRYIMLFLVILFSSSCAFMPKCHNRQCGVRMEHYHNGYEYRGVSLLHYLFKYRNPRTGDGFKENVKDPAALVKK